MKLLIIGEGGREHALAWKAAQSPLVSHIYVAPGNAGTALEGIRHPTACPIDNIEIGSTDIAQLVTFAQQNQVGLTWVGPEKPLVQGIVDAFREADLAILGPTQAAAQLEGSKAFMKAFLQRHRIPTADYQIFTEIPAALAYLRQPQLAPKPWVIKADGLAAGKGVTVAATLAEAEAAASSMLSGEAFGEAGRRIVIEEFLVGEEVSFMVLVDGQQLLPLATSQDHKAIGEGDQGANTGGMGAYSPAPIVTETLQERILQEIIWPTVRGMALEGTPYTGFLYAGLMILPDGSPKVIEFNCRLGDPEAQALLLRLRSDLVALSLATVAGQLQQCTIDWDPRSALGVVLTTSGYPGPCPSGEVITGLPTEELLNPTDTSQKLFFCGTHLVDDQVLTQGGRVLCATALGDTLAIAQSSAYQLAQQLHWPGLYYRRDIGHRALQR
ncbi:phosphoribosylamine--glycine ligase [unidentified bacterial endosymbiont]|uniref:phosphoribosylamine--glycine ligase n=1 Tax=unidentified bacterial endosymbiont TaxID=2355 RepID=UPI00209C927E|nr:phosphoribosylamine--glycine ligase [unidentified bacterial endosymbiont]